MKVRDLKLEDFKANDDTVLVSTIGAVSQGVNLPQVTRTIVDSLPWNVGTLEQWYRRAVRLTSTEPVEVHVLTNNNSIDMNLWALIAAKQVLTKKIQDGEDVDVDEELTRLGFHSSESGTSLKLDPFELALKYKKEKDADGHSRKRLDWRPVSGWGRVEIEGHR